MGSKKYQLNRTDLSTAARRIGWYTLGSFLVITATVAGDVDFDRYQAVASLVIGFVLDLGSQFVKDNSSN